MISGRHVSQSQEAHLSRVEGEETLHCVAVVQYTQVSVQKVILATSISF